MFKPLRNKQTNTPKKLTIKQKKNHKPNSSNPNQRQLLPLTVLGYGSLLRVLLHLFAETQFQSCPQVSQVRTEGLRWLRGGDCLPVARKELQTALHTALHLLCLLPVRYSFRFEAHSHLVLSSCCTP